MFKRTVFLLVLAALALPALAAAQKLDVKGPILVKGRGPLHGELSMANASATRPVHFVGRRGLIRFVDLAGDLRVQCQGRGRAKASENAQGQKVFTCLGRGGRAKVHGSKFRLRGALGQYTLLIPAGVTGTLEGRFRVERGGGAPQRGDAERGRPTPSTDEEEQSDEDVPSIDEVKKIVEQELDG